MEEISATNPEYQPLRVLWHHSCAHARKTIPIAPIHSFTKQIVPSMYQESLSWSRLISITRVFRNHLINSPFHQKYFRCPSFFFFYFLSFHHTLFRGLAGACLNPESFSLFVHSLVCQITHSFLSQTCINTSPMYALPVILFSALECI